MEKYLLDLLDWLDTQPEDIKEGVREVLDDYFTAALES